MSHNNKNEDNTEIKNTKDTLTELINEYNKSINKSNGIFAKYLGPSSNNMIELGKKFEIINQYDHAINCYLKSLEIFGTNKLSSSSNKNSVLISSSLCEVYKLLMKCYLEKRENLKTLSLVKKNDKIQEASYNPGLLGYVRVACCQHAFEYGMKLFELYKSEKKYLEGSQTILDIIKNLGDFIDNATIMRLVDEGIVLTSSCFPLHTIKFLTIKYKLFITMKTKKEGLEVINELCNFHKCPISNKIRDNWLMDKCLCEIIVNDHVLMLGHVVFKFPHFENTEQYNFIKRIMEATMTEDVETIITEYQYTLQFDEEYMQILFNELRNLCSLS